MLDCIDNIVEFIDNNGGFVVTVWYNIGTINDIVLIDLDSSAGGRIAAGNNNQENQVTASDVNYHVVEMLLTN